MSLSGMQSASDLQMDYMKLLVTQLQNQNPMEPMDNNDMASQLAQFSSLQQLESIGSNFTDVLSAVEQSYGSGLIGKEVRYLGQAEDGSRQIFKGMVQGMFRDVEDGNKVKLIVDEQVVNLKDVVGVSDLSAASNQLEHISNGFDHMLGTIQRDYANSLIGREVAFRWEDSQGSGTDTGVVESVFTDAEGQLKLAVNDRHLNLSDITGVNI